METNTNPRLVLRDLREKWRESVQRCPPSRQYGASLLLGLVGLHLTAREIRNSKTTQQRKEALHAFQQTRSIVEQALTYLGTQTPAGSSGQETDRAVSGLR